MTETEYKQIQEVFKPWQSFVLSSIKSTYRSIYSHWQRSFR